MNPSDALGSKTLEWCANPVQFAAEVFGFKPDPWQEEALKAFPHRQRIAMQSCKGPGKGLNKSLELLTPSGMRRWGDLQVGDQVFAEDGSPATILAVHQLGVIPLFRVTFDDGSSTECCADHLWKVQGRTERRNSAGWSILNTKEIIRRGVTVPNGKWEQKQFIIPRQGEVQFPTAILPLDPYLAGVWIGDGTKQRAEYSKPYVEVELEIRRRGYRTSRTNDGSKVRILGSVAAFEALECFTLGSYGRFIPDAYKMASVEQRTDLLRGLMDADGSIGKDTHTEFSTTSERLANDVVWLVRSLGGVAYVKEAIKQGWYRDEDGVRIDCRDCYRVSIRTPFNPFLATAHKAERWRDPFDSPSTGRYLTRFIASIEPAGEADSMCIEIDHPSHCYLANDFIVTHNSCVLAILGWHMLVCYPNPMIGVCSSSSPNLFAGLWVELARWKAKSSGNLLEQMFATTSREIYLRERPDTWMLQARTWKADATPEQIGTSLAGLHADYIAWILDETGDYPDAILPTVEAIFAGQPKFARIVMAGNPTRLSGPLYTAAGRARDLWKVIAITADPDDPKRTPRVSVEHAREQIKLYGRDNPWVLINIFGQFPPSSLNSLIGVDEVAAAMRRSYREYEIGQAARVIGVDVARFGADRSVMSRRQGIQMAPFRIARDIDSTQGAGWVAREAIEWKADATFIDDTGGFGSGWIDQMRALGQTPIGVAFSGEASNKARYYNKRSEMAFELVEWIKDGGALPAEDSPGAGELLAALTQTTYAFKGDRLILEPKEAIKAKLGYSPDEADAAMLTFAHPVSPNVDTRRIYGRTRSKHTFEYNPFSDA